MQRTSKYKALLAGFAMFSMFFGAGNVVYPLELGQEAGGSIVPAALGFLSTAILFPFAGLMSVILFDGDYDTFFMRMGKIPGMIIAAIAMVLIGPGGALPRTVALSFSTLTPYLPNLNLSLFALLSCVVIFGLSYRKNKVLDVIGYFLTPILLFSLFCIIVVGIFSGQALPPSLIPTTTALTMGLSEGYQTMDLIASFFFSHVVLSCLREEVSEEDAQDPRRMTRLTLKASLIGAGLLGAVYAGFAYVSALYSSQLEHVPSDQLIGVLGRMVLGNYAGLFASVAVFLACLTTAIALSAVFAEYLQNDILKNKLGYVPCLLLTLGGTYFISTLSFTGIKALLTPILVICYPALIVLCAMNLLEKLVGIRWVKIPVALTFAWSLYSTFVL